jgi:hypothetical protein
MKFAIRSILPLTVLLASLIVVASASANEYIVYSCKTPAGTPAPTDGWSSTGGATFGWTSDTCNAGGSLGAGMSGPSQAANTRIGWGFDSGAAPIRGYTITRDGRINGSAWGASMMMFTANAQNDPDGSRRVDYCAFFEGCSSLAGSVTRDAATIPAGSRGWFFTMGCGGYSDQLCTHSTASADFGEVRVRSAVFRLEDSEQPTVAGVGGSLASEGASSGTLTVVASDDVSGVARATIEADGAEVVAVVPNANDGRCVRVGQAGATNDYLYRRPCPARQQVELTLPRGSLANGTHVIRARVFDAAGNGVTAFGPKQIQVTGSALTGLSAARISLDGPTAISARYGKLVHVHGALHANTGDPIAGARIESHFDSSSAVRARIASVVHSDSDGRFTIPISATASRRWSLEAVESGAQLTGRLTVHSRVRLRAAHKRIPARGRMRLSGSIPGERARHGASVAIKVRSGRRWRTVAVVRTNRAGAFKFSYRFRRVNHARLQFRAVALKSSDLTVSASPSMPLTIRVG